MKIFITLILFLGCLFLGFRAYQIHNDPVINIFSKDKVLSLSIPEYKKFVRELPKDDEESQSFAQFFAGSLKEQEKKRNTYIIASVACLLLSISLPVFWRKKRIPKQQEHTNDHTIPTTQALSFSAFLCIFIGVTVSVLASLIFYDSILFWFSNDVYEVDWKEFKIACAFLVFSFLVIFFGVRFTATGLLRRIRVMFFVAPTILAFVLSLVFNFKVEKPHWYTQNVEVQVVSNGQTLVLRNRVLIPETDTNGGHTESRSNSNELVGSWRVPKGPLRLTITKVNETKFDIVFSGADSKDGNNEMSGQYTYNEIDKSLSKEVLLNANDPNTPRVHKFTLSDDGRLNISGFFFIKDK